VEEDNRFLERIALGITIFVAAVVVIIVLSVLTALVLGVIALAGLVL